MHIAKALSGAAATAFRFPRPGREATRRLAVTSSLLILACSASPSFAQSYVSSLNNINGPTFVAIDQSRAIAGTTSSWLYVSEHGSANNTGGGRILRYNLSALSSAPVDIGNGHFVSPDGILVDAATGDLIIADRAQDHITRIGTDGTVKWTFGSGTAGAPDEMHGPCGLAMDSSGAIYLTEHGETLSSPPGAGGSYVSKYTVSATGQAQRQFRIGGVGAGNSQFASTGPYGVAVANNQLLVSDGFNSRVEVFGLDGTFVNQFSIPNTLPLGLYVDSGGSMWVAESSGAGSGSTQQVQKMSAAGVSSGVVLTTSGPSLSLPFDAVVDATTNRAYVADYNNNRVAIFDLSASSTGGTSTGGTSTGGTSSGGTSTGGTSTGGTSTGGTSTGTTTTGTAAAALGPKITHFDLDASSVTRGVGGDFLVTFDTGVTGVDATDFTMNSQGGANAVITGVTAVDAMNYRVHFTYSDVTGWLQLGIKSASTGIANATSGDAFQGSGLTASPTYGTGGNGATVLQPVSATISAGTVSGLTLPFTVTFSSAVTGVDAGDFVISGTSATINTITPVSSTTYTVNTTASGTGTVTLNAIGGVTSNIKDSAGNWFAGAASSSATITGGSSTGGTSTGGTSTGGTSTGGTSTGGTSTGGTSTGGTSTGGSSTGGTSTGGTSTGASTAHVVSVTAPANGTYSAGDALAFTVHFSGAVRIVTGHAESGKSNNPDQNDKGDGNSKPTKPGDDNNSSGDGSSGTSSSGSATSATSSTSSSTVANPPSTDDSNDQSDSKEGTLSISWTAVAAAGQTADSGAAGLVGPIGTTDLTFKYQVHGNDSAPQGIRLGTTIDLPAGTILTDASGHPLSAADLTLPWAQNPLPGVVLVPANQANHGGPAAGGPAGNGAGDEHTRLVNLSSRVHFKHGDASHAVVVGFVVSGTGSQSLLIRAVGPGLTSFGVTDALLDTMLTVQNSAGQVVATNNGWGNNSLVSQVGLQVGAFGLASGSHDSAVVVSLRPGAYTATITGGNADGEALLEVYDAAAAAATAASPQLVNMSTRGYVDTDGNLIVGFVVQGNAPKQVLVRAVGPGLAPFGVTGTLSDPVLQVLNSGGTVMAKNDNWSTPEAVTAPQPAATATQVAAAFSAVGAFPLSAGSNDAALLVTLPPGAYTAVVTGANHASGAVLVEVYQVATP